jgi:ketopantoate reductase
MTVTFVKAPAKPARRERSYVPTGEVGQRLSRARELQLQIQELTALYDAERTWLLEHMQSQALTNVALGEVKCVLKSRARWSYSIETQREMEALQVTQKWEQSRGIASNEPSFYVSIAEAKA